jgi:uracil phosphoribosyltransferase
VCLIPLVTRDRSAHVMGQQPIDLCMAREYARGVVVFDHPLIQHKLSHLRDKTVSHRPFRALLYQIAGLMVYEVTEGLPTREVIVQTPLESMKCVRLAHNVTVVPVLRSGLGMAEGIMEMMPEARIGHLGLARDEHTLEPRVYLQRLPKDIADGPVILVDPMLATGGSASAAVQILKDAGATDMRMICLVAAPEGIARLRRDHPDMMIYTAAVDRQLNERGFICPGLGDAGDRMYGTE